MAGDQPPPADQPPHAAGADQAGAEAVRDPAGRAIAGGSPAEAAGDWLAAEVAVAVRRIRELRAETGQLHERLTAVDEQVRLTGARHAQLAAAVSEDLAPRVGALQQLVTEELGQLRGDVDTLLADRRSEDNTKNPPVDWTALTAGQAAEQWPILAAWIGEVLVPWCEWTRNELPDCWALHRPVVVELSWLRTTHVAAYLPKAPAHLAAEWHTRWRPASLTGIKEAMKSTQCGLGKHTPRSGPPLQVDVPAGETAATRATLAVPKFWWPFYARAVDEDLAARHARAGAASLDWFPQPAGSSG